MVQSSQLPCFEICVIPWHERLNRTMAARLLCGSKVGCSLASTTAPTHAQRNKSGGRSCGLYGLPCCSHALVGNTPTLGQPTRVATLPQLPEHRPKFPGARSALATSHPTLWQPLRALIQQVVCCPARQAHRMLSVCLARSACDAQCHKAVYALSCTLRYCPKAGGKPIVGIT